MHTNKLSGIDVMFLKAACDAMHHSAQLLIRDGSAIGLDGRMLSERRQMLIDDVLAKLE